MHNVIIIYIRSILFVTFHITLVSKIIYAFDGYCNRYFDFLGGPVLTAMTVYHVCLTVRFLQISKNLLGHHDGLFNSIQEKQYSVDPFLTTELLKLIHGALS